MKRRLATNANRSGQSSRQVHDAFPLAARSTQQLAYCEETDPLHGATPLLLCTESRCARRVPQQGCMKSLGGNDDVGQPPGTDHSDAGLCRLLLFMADLLVSDRTP
jgi:hypothetical protein